MLTGYLNGDVTYAIGHVSQETDWGERYWIHAHVQYALWVEVLSSHRFIL